MALPKQTSSNLSGNELVRGTGRNLMEGAFNLSAAAPELGTTVGTTTVSVVAALGAISVAISNEVVDMVKGDEPKQVTKK